MLSIKEYCRAESLEEAWQLNQKRSSRILGGMLWLKMGKGTVGTAIDLSGLGLDTIEETDEAFSIGCMTSLRQLETHEGLHTYTNGAMKEAVRHIVGVQFRNLATVGGSIWGRFGFSDVLTLFLAMESYVELYKGGVIPLRDFAEAKPDRDILVRIVVKKRPGRFHYQSVRNSQTDFPVLACAAALFEGTQWRFSVGARPGRAVVLEDEGEMLSLPVSGETAVAFGEYAAKQLPTGSNMRGSAAYRSHLIKVLTRRAILTLGGEQA